jgi:hypothetical protein
MDTLVATQRVPLVAAMQLRTVTHHGSECDAATAKNRCNWLRGMKILTERLKRRSGTPLASRRRPPQCVAEIVAVIDRHLAAAGGMRMTFSESLNSRSLLRLLG